MNKQWYFNGDGYQCPVCGYFTYNPDKRTGRECPMCGFQEEEDINDRKRKSKYDNLQQRQTHRR